MSNHLRLLGPCRLQARNRQAMQSITCSSLLSPLSACHSGAGAWPWLQTTRVSGSNTEGAAGITKSPTSLQRCLASWKPQSNERSCFALPRKHGFRPPNGGKHSPDIAETQTKDVADFLNEKIGEIKYMFSTMGDGHISISPYDTAWVALVKNTHGHGVPHFPSSLQWIIDHQLEDGSWGDEFFFNGYDRLLSTLACVIAIKRWEGSQYQSNRGIEFLQANMGKLREESEDHLPAGFEVVFPSLLDMARSLSIDIRCDSSILQAIGTMRERKLKRIPLDLLHNVPTTLLYSLEGLQSLNWKKLLQLKCSDGSFLGSPASTAFAVMETKDESCIKYLENVVSRFGGGVPAFYPVDLFERLWMVDRLQRLGISRYFQDEINESLEYVFKYWTNNGLYPARNWSVPDIDDTAMGFRILRLHGFNVSPVVFQNFYKNGQFFCMEGQTRETITPLYNLNRASQVAFPREGILEEAKRFSYRYLREKQAKKQLLDKWIITKDLPGEVDYALDFPWIMSLPRVEARIYLDQYGGDGDVWIAKTLYSLDKSPNLITALLQSIEDISIETTMSIIVKSDNGGYDKQGLFQMNDEIKDRLLHAWYDWMFNILNNGFIAHNGEIALLLVRILELCAGRFDLENAFSYFSLKGGLNVDPVTSHNDDSGMTNVREYIRLASLTKSICHSHTVQKSSSRQEVGDFVMGKCDGGSLENNSFEYSIQELTKRVLDGCSPLNNNTRETFLKVVKSFYYAAHCPPSTMDLHISKVLFERIP